jgi:tetratricopeptide (TPR) repeat protein
MLALVERLKPAIEQRDRPTLVDIIGQLAGMRASMGGQWQALANLAAQNGELTLARQAIDLFVEAHSATPGAQFQKAALLMNIGAWAEAHALLCTLRPDVPSPTAYAHTRGAAALYSGKTGDAREQLELATRLTPQSGSSWYLLSLVADLENDPDLAHRLISAEPAIEWAQPSEKAAYGYALGRLFAGRGEPKSAIAAFARAARQMKSLQSYDPDQDRAWAADAIHGYSAQRIAAIAGRQREETAKTIFVTGLPRSGTTLVAQILTAHSEVADGAEIARLGLLAQDVGGQSWQALIRYLETRDVASVARLWRHWMDERFPGSARVVDKTVDASRFLGFAAALLPDAPLVWVTRDPVDCAWSCFRTCFLNIPWTNDLDDIAFHFRLEDRLRAQWQETLGERLLIVPYEALVASPAQWIGRILRHCGLREEPQVFQPEDNPSAMATPSVRQVRRPINRDSIGLAEPYRAFLQPFIESYSR